MAYGTINADLMTTSDGVSSSGLYGFKNRIINGAMVIDQRNAGASVTQVTGNTYTVDRFYIVGSVTSKFTAQQSSTVPSGFVNSLKITSSAATSLASGDYYFLAQNIEGNNIADLNWGSANAKTITLSFQVYSSLTGTFGGALRNSAQDRSYPFTYSIPVANTWTSISITIAGDTSGTWNTTTSTGINVVFSLGMGSTYSGTAGVWASSNYASATGATSVVGTNGATFYITGVQLEKGSTATSFDYRPYGTELQLCQRYYAKMGQGSAQYAAFGAGMYNTSTGANLFLKYPNTMRASPTLSYGGNVQVTSGGGGNNITAVNNTYMGLDSCLWQPSGISGTTGYGATLMGNADSTCYVAFSAEL
jgi:hypothetical protein